MKGFGQKDPQQNTKKIINAIPNEKKLISDALSLHSKGQLKDASNIYLFLIKSGCNDSRVHINLGAREGTKHKRAQVMSCTPFYAVQFYFFPRIELKL